MTSTTTNPAADLPDQETSVYLFDDWFDPIEAGVLDRARGFIETMIRTELDTVLARPRYARQPAANHGSDAGVAGHRHGSRTRTLTGTFGSLNAAILVGVIAAAMGWALYVFPRRDLGAPA